MQRYYSVVYYSKFDLYFYRWKTYQKESKIILFFLQNYIFLSDERPDSLIFENVLGESSPPARCPIPDGGQVGIQPVSPVNLQMLGQVVRPGKTLLTYGASEKNEDISWFWTSAKSILFKLLFLQCCNFLLQVHSVADFPYFARRFLTLPYSICVSMQSGSLILWIRINWIYSNPR